MRIRELLLDAVISTKIFEMAFKRKNAIDKIRNKQDVISEHLLKVLLFPNSRDVPGWKKELDVWLYDIGDIILKPYGDRLYSSDYMNLLFDEPIGTIRDIENKIKKIYRMHELMVPGTIDPLDISKQSALIMKSISNDLSVGEYKGIKSYL